MDGYFSFDPIYALATPPIKSAIAVFRVSGKGCIALLNMALDKPIDLNSKSFVSSKALFYRKILLSDKSILDDCLVSVFKDGSGYTKEEAAEISVHGSLAVISALDDLFLKTGFRKALKGEFTFRAMQNGRLTLLESEAVLELIDSDSEVMRKNASLRLSGALDKKLNSIYEELLEISSIFELQMDYSDDEFDEDVSFPKEKIDIVKNKIIKLLQSFQISRKEEDGIKIVLLGDTNAGKSTLFNYLLRENRSIVSNRRGTTRDYIKEEIELFGYKVVLYDTAGLNANAKEVEKSGIKRTLSLVKNADIIIKFLNKAEMDAQRTTYDKRYIFIKNKIDKKDFAYPDDNTSDVVFISAKNGENIDKLLVLLKERIALLTQSDFGLEGVFVNSIRQKRLLEDTLDSLNALKENEKIEILTIEAQNALVSIRALLGMDDESVSNTVLDEIFSRFCVGK